MFTSSPLPLNPLFTRFGSLLLLAWKQIYTCLVSLALTSILSHLLFNLTNVFLILTVRLCILEVIFAIFYNVHFIVFISSLSVLYFFKSSEVVYFNLALGYLSHSNFWVSLSCLVVLLLFTAAEFL